MNFRADRIGDELILAQLERNESDLLGAANALDVKASQLFAAGAFLAVQPAVVLAQSALDTPVVWMQAGTCIALVALVLCANEAFRPRDYDTVNVTEEWRDELIAQLNPDQRELDGVAWLTWGLIDGLKKRIETAKRLHMDGSL